MTSRRPWRALQDATGCKLTVSFSWLVSHLEDEVCIEDIIGTLSRIGVPAKSIDHRGAKLSAFRVAHIVDAARHPNADRLLACRVDAGDGRIMSIVCGAPNVRTGLKIVMAPPGSYIPGTGMTIKTTEIRGVISQGMLLSAYEMGIGTERVDIVELPDDAPAGMPYVTWAGLDDPLIEINGSSMRGDLLSVRGLARELDAMGAARLKEWNPEPVPRNFPSPLQCDIALSATASWMLGRTIIGVRNGPSPRWLANRLIASGINAVNLLVDVGNYLMLDLGCALHVFDAGKVSGDMLTLRSGAGEILRALDGHDYAISPADGVVADARGPLSLAGLMNGETAACDNATTSIFVLCAQLDPAAIALSGESHGIDSEGRRRLERGVDHAMVASAVEAATRLIVDHCGGQASDVARAGEQPGGPRTATLRFAKLAQLGGLDIPSDEAVRALGRLGFAVVAREATRVVVSVPSWRQDIYRLNPVPTFGGHEDIVTEAALVGEVLRFCGLDAVPAIPMPISASMPPARPSPSQSRTISARRALVGRGLTECVTLILVDGPVAALFAPADPSPLVGKSIVPGPERPRATPLTTLALAARHNAVRGLTDLAFFEIGPGFRAGKLEHRHAMAAGLRSGQTARAWFAPARDVDVFDAKADAWIALEAVGVVLETVSVTSDAPAFYHPGQSGVVRQGAGTVLATFGALHPRLLAELDLPDPVVAFEIFLDVIAEPKRRRRATPDGPVFEPQRRSFMFVVGQHVTAAAVLQAARRSYWALISGVSLLAVDTGGIPETGCKAVSIGVIFQPRERALTSVEIEAACARVVAAVTKATGGASVSVLDRY